MNIRQQLLIPPGALLVLMLLLGVTGFLGLNASNNSVRDLYDTRFHAFKGSSDALADVAAAHADVYRLFTWLKNYDAAKTKLATDEINQRVYHAVAQLKTLEANQAFSGETRKALMDLQKDIAEYRKQVMQAIEYAQIDPNMGITGMQDADRDFTSLQRKAEQLVAEQAAKAKESYSNSISAFRSSLAIFVAILLLAIVVGVTISLLLARKITHPLRQAIASAQRIAEGDLTSRIDVIQNDETGDLLRALSCMQDSLQQIVGEIKSVVHAGEQGDFTHSIDLNGKSGFGRDIGESLNRLNSGILQQIGGSPADAVAVARRIAEGDLSVPIRLLPGDHGSILAAMSTMRHELEGVIENVRQMVNAAADGDFSRHIESADKKGYAKTLSDLLNRLSDTAREALIDISEVAQALAEGNLTRQVEKDYPGLFGSTARGINGTSEHLRELIGSVVEAVNAISQAAREIAQGNKDLSERTEEQSSNLEETTSNMDQLTSVVQANAGNANQANELVRQSSRIAVEGGEVVHASVLTMQDISESSRKIVDIIGLINGIAFQTNILALNAAVEAARAGEQGRGFAVVASEVRNLAQRSAAAAQEIKELISLSLDKVEVGTRRVNHAGDKMDEIVASITRVSHIIANISCASTEQATGIAQINRAISMMDEVTQQNAAQVEQVAAAAESLEEQAHHLQSLVAHFRLDRTESLTTTATWQDVEVVDAFMNRAANARFVAKRVGNNRITLSR